MLESCVCQSLELSKTKFYFCISELKKKKKNTLMPNQTTPQIIQE